jgi:hypothetical protein
MRAERPWRLRHCGAELSSDRAQRFDAALSASEQDGAFGGDVQQLGLPRRLVVGCPRFAQQRGRLISVFGWPSRTARADGGLLTARRK